MSYCAEIISVGTEILLGNIVNTDARDISQMLSELGINVYYQTVVGDNPERLKKAVEIAKGRADIIITTGGLGPTCDDLTKQTLIEAFNKETYFDAEAERIMLDYFKKRGKPVTENNYQQVYLPVGCVPFENTCGTAPGCAFEADGKYVLMLPGPPRECVTMMKVSGIPYLKSLSDSEIYSHNIHIFGLGESNVGDKLYDMMMELSNPTLAPYAKDGECYLRVTAKGKSQEECEKLMEPVIAEVRRRLGDVVYSVDVETLEETAFLLMRDRGLTLSAAESCTGGLLAKRITDIPGASAVFRGGAVTYATDTKASLLGVDSQVLKNEGPVCSTVAVQMAEGVRQRFGSDIGVGITGIAGPDTDEFGAAVGTVFVAMSVDGKVFCRHLTLGSDRERIRTAAVHNAFDMIRRYLTGLEVE